MEHLMAAIVIWLSANFSLPENFDFPDIAFVPPTELAELRYKQLLSAKSTESAVPKKQLSKPNRLRPLVAFYNTQTKTIHLPEGWQGSTANELSILVHELVHHLQGKSGASYECSAAREKIAYEAQDRWLRMFGSSLEKEFGIDRLTIMVTTSCAFLDHP